MGNEKKNHDTEYLIDLAKKSEAEAAEVRSDSARVQLFRKAAGVYNELGCYGDEARCLNRVAELLKGLERIDCLVLAWGAYMNALTSYKFESSFEWKGETENLDPNYGHTVDRYYSGAVDALEEAVKTPGVDREKLLQRLYVECVRRRNEGGWGEQECFESIEESFKGKKIKQ